MSPSVPIRSMLTFSPSMLTSTALSRFDEPMLMLTARFIICLSHIGIYRSIHPARGHSHAGIRLEKRGPA